MTPSYHKLARKVPRCSLQSTAQGAYENVAPIHILKSSYILDSWNSKSKDCTARCFTNDLQRRKANLKSSILSYDYFTLSIKKMAYI